MLGCEEVAGPHPTGEFAFPSVVKDGRASLCDGSRSEALIRGGRYSLKRAGPAPVTKNCAAPAVAGWMDSYSCCQRRTNAFTVPCATRAQTLPPKPAPNAEAA